MLGDDVPSILGNAKLRTSTSAVLIDTFPYTRLLFRFGRKHKLFHHASLRENQDLESVIPFRQSVIWLVNE